MERWQVCGHLVGNCVSCLAENCYYIKFSTGQWNCVHKLSGWKDVQKIIAPIFPEKCESVWSPSTDALASQIASEESGKFGGTFFDARLVAEWMDVAVIGIVCILFMWICFIQEKERRSQQSRPAITHQILLTSSPPRPPRRRIRRFE
ncbi:hypothetical protein Ocin01_11698 [Orchesella cincta]|uniref:Uncharacterized protein n=1 Tax=Orchesella cincta TaxID=48709 RepID=A0A1D2MPG6_ORCCI|nr:hypothetical protein Ocin01_11698 [Orchesella cincta]